jgi:large subunit ribosomal protein L10
MGRHCSKRLLAGFFILSHMPVTKDQKKEIVGKLSSIARDSKSVVFVNFHGLTVGDTSAMRKELREKGVEYFVSKKTLAKRALGEAGFQGEMPILDGELAMVYGSDLLAPAREVYEFQKKYKDGLTIIGGVFEGKFMDKEEMTGIALIPPLQVLYAQFVNLINSPIQRLAVVMNAIAESKS